MGLVDGLNRIISLLVDTLRQIGRGRIWLWLLGYFLVSWFVLYALYDFTSPIFYGLVSMLIGVFGQQQATGFMHYPGHFLLLPYVFEYIKIGLSIIFEGLILGAAAILFYESYVDVDEDDRFAVGSLVKSWLHLALGFVIINGILLGLNIGLATALRSYMEYSPRRVLAFEWVILPAVYAVVLGIFFHVLPSIAIYRENVFVAISKSVRVFFKNPISMFILAAIVLAVPIAISNFTAHPDTIVNKFTPELVYWVLAVGLFVDMIANFLWMGMSVRFLVDEEE